jgi:hypothetical protein
MNGTGAARRDAGVATGLLVLAIYLGSGGLVHFDPALAGYCAATVVAAGAVAYRVAVFWRRPASAVYGRALLAALRRPRHLRRVLSDAGRHLGTQRFIARRGAARWVAHLLLSWGTLASFAITLPLVWGWIHFEAVESGRYRVFASVVPVGRFETGGWVGWLIFHQLSLAAVAVVLGVLYFLVVRRRGAAHGAAARFHLGPLVLLLAVALTGLALPVTSRRASYELYALAALSHQVAVVLLLALLPYGKLVHLFIRPLQVGVHALRRLAPGRTHCAGCGADLALAAQHAAVTALLAARGLRFAEHARLCPACRRRRVAACHGALVGTGFAAPPPTHLRSREAA